MQLSAVVLARYVALFETADLDPLGRLFYPNLFKALIAKASFQKVPDLAKVDDSKGIELSDGYWGDIAIQKLTIFSNGIALDTRSSTDDSERIVDELLKWAKVEFKIHYEPGMIKRHFYVSQLTFHSDAPLISAANPAVVKLCERVTRIVSGLAGQELPYEPTIITMQHDALLRKDAVAGFTIQRRAQTPFSENKYFSEAPLQTKMHKALLNDFEAAIISSVI